ncbi:hypothetical protein SAMN04489832_1471 [Micromonospora cremea]|uniref:Uncharacterized protein n=1 Tax=Micromonospora cremea TaxID=709881 RepID=A0A1N5VA58_9ACTN|nr:hypothetical protein SAMN04489832_1471 [Micromonospora cremea]
MVTGWIAQAERARAEAASSLRWAAASSWSASYCFSRNGVVAGSHDLIRFTQVRPKAILAK